jgi:phosphoadenosine phosphosulfate reductase
VRLRGGLLYLRDAQVLTAAASPRSEVPYNALLDAGYKSIGDWHSTAPPTAATSAAGSGTATPASDADERSGRWAAKQGAKTECGLHKDYFKMKRQFEKRVREEELRQADDRKDGSEPIGDLDATAPTDGGVVVDAQ